MLQPTDTPPISQACGLTGLLCRHVLNDRYLVSREISQGGMGAVYEAQDLTAEPIQPGSGRVAVKVCAARPAEADLDGLLRARFQREAEILARLTKRDDSPPEAPGVVRYLDHGHDPRLGIDYIVQELIEGVPLNVWVEQHAPVSPSVALMIIAQVLSCLNDSHTRQIIHRDIKPQNLILVNEASIRLIDFGISALHSANVDLTPLTRTGVSPCTPRWASPEQLLRAKEITAATDLYSTGLLLYQLLTGTTPVVHNERRRDQFDLHDFETRCRKARCPAISAALLSTFTGLTARDPRLRWSASTHLHNLHAALDAALEYPVGRCLAEEGYRPNPGYSYHRLNGLHKIRYRNEFDKRPYGLSIISTATYWLVEGNWMLEMAAPPEDAHAQLTDAVGNCNNSLRTGHYTIYQPPRFSSGKTECRVRFTSRLPDPESDLDAMFHAITDLVWDLQRTWSKHGSLGTLLL